MSSPLGGDSLPLALLRYGLGMSHSSLGQIVRTGQGLRDASEAKNAAFKSW